MRDHASRIPIVIAARVGRILGIYRPLQQIDIDVEGELFPRGVMWAATISYWLLVPFAVMGTVTLRRRRVPLYPLLAMPTSVLLTVVLFYSSMRFRASAEGVLCLAAAVGLGALLARRWPEPGNGLDVESEIDRPGAT
jgi:hypothetical protein